MIVVSALGGTRTIGKTRPTLQHYIVDDNKIISFLISDYFVDIH